MSLADINTLVGVTASWVGIGVVGQDAVASWWAFMKLRAGRRWKRLRAWRRGAVPEVTALIGLAASVEAAATVSGTGWVWPSGGSVEERIEALYQHILAMEQRHHVLGRKIDQQHATVQHRVAIVDADRQRTDAELRQLVDDGQARATLIDARGLIPLALGVLLASAPSQLAALPWLFAWPFPITAAGAAVYTLYLVAIRDRSRRPSAVSAG